MIDQEIQARMDAFRGNPQALMQRYAQNQQLVDLLALQKLKSEKEAAARQIQMQMGQGQMPTVAQQREQELMGMAKQEVAQRVGAVGQQQAQQQQQNLQRAAQTGIAQAPAPNMMPAQAMASGGIVAFSGGGGTAFERWVSAGINKDENERRKALLDLAAQYDLGPFQGAFTLPAEEYDTKKAVREYLQENMRTLAKDPAKYEAFVRDPVGIATRKVGVAAALPAAPAAPAPAAPSSPAFARPDKSYASKEARGMAIPQVPSTQEQYDTATFKLGTGPGESYEQAMREAESIPNPKERAAVIASLQRAKPADANVQGIAQAAAGAQPQATSAQPTGLRGNLETYLSGPLSKDPAAAQAAARAEYEKDYSPLYKEQQALQQEGIAQLRERMAQQQARQDPLLAWMAGARGRTIGEVLGSAGRAGVGYQAEQAAAQAALQDQLQKLRESEMTGRIGQVEKARAAGTKGREEAVTAAEKAAQVAGTYLSRTDVDAVRSQLNETRLTLMQQGLDDRRIAAAMATADRKVKMLNDRWEELEREKVKPAVATNAAELAKINSEQTRIKEEMQNTPSEMLRLFSVNVPDYKAKSTAPVASNIPPMPKDAVRPKGAK